MPGSPSAMDKRGALIHCFLAGNDIFESMAEDMIGTEIQLLPKAGEPA